MTNNHLHPKRAFRSILLLLLLSMGISNAFAVDYDFSAVAPSGQTLYYKIITNSNIHEVQVTYPRDYSTYSGYGTFHAYWYGYDTPVGDVIIPSIVENDGVSYIVTSIREHAFDGGSRWGNGVATYYCDGITSVVLPSTIEVIGEGTFKGCRGLLSLAIPNSVTYIDNYAFYGCSSLTSVTIPNSVTYLGHNAFYNCSSMTSLTIGSSVTTLDNHAFYGCTQLSEIISLNATPPSATSGAYGNNGFVSDVFEGILKTIPVYVPMGSASAYQSATGWNEFTNYIEVVANFSATCSSGQTVYYAVTDLANHFVEAVYPGSSSSAPWEGYEQPTGNLVLPETVQYQGITYIVKGIHNNAFYGCNGLTQVTISDNINHVGAKAFWNCPNLETVVFNAEDCAVMQTRTGSGTNSNPYVYFSVFSADEAGSAPNLTRISIGSGVQHIPDYAFMNSEDVYQRLVIPASVTDIGNYAFYGCNSMVQMVIQGNGLQTIGNYAFYGCSALQTALNLPNSVVSTGEYAFYGCTHIPSLTIGEGMSQIGAYTFWNCPAMVTVNFNAVNCINMQTVDYSDFNSGTEAGGATPITTLNIGANVTNIPDFAFRNSPNATNNLVLPEGLLNIGQYAFHNGGFTGDLTIPNTTQTIGQYAFYGCGGLTALTIGEGVESIGGCAYWNCPQIQTVNFNAVNCTTMNTDGSCSVFNIGTNNGGETPITSLTIGANVTSIPDFAFYNSPNATNTLPLPNGLLNIGSHTFDNCSGMTGALSIPNTVTSIGQYGFYHCSGFDESLTLSNSLSTINAYTFCGCSGLTGTLTIPNSVLTIAEHAFEDCSGFTGSLVIHDALTSIGESAFYGCSNISELILGEGVETIGGSAFWNCPEMHTVHFNSMNCTSMNTSGAYSVFNVGTTSSGATPIVTLSIGENVTRIPDYAFRNSLNATSKIVIPNATTYIGTYSFFGFRSDELTIGEGVAEIGGYAFWYCPNLQTVHFNAINCTNMKTQTGSGNNIVYYSVFNGGMNATSSPSVALLTIGKKVQTIPDYAFKNCSSANCKLLFPNTLTSIGVQAFYEGNNFIGDLVLPNSVTSLGEYAFYNCHSFDGSLIIGSGIHTINQYTFADCDGFTGALIIGRSVETIGDYSFRNCSGFSTVISEHPTPPTALNTSFNNMTYTIPVHVPYAMVPAYQAATGWSLFTNYREQFVFDQLDNDLWSDTQNWYSFALPTANDVVCVNSNCQMDMEAEVLHLYVLNLNDVMTINNGETLSVTYGIGTLQPSQLVIADGGQLVNPVSNAYGTVQRNISGYGTGSNGWFTLGTPIYEGTATSTFATGTYDLFYYDEPTHYWMNEKIGENGLTMLEPAQGYLYANQAQQTIAFAGQINASNAEFSLPVTCEGSPLAGYTLVGNPYTNNLNISDVKLNGTALTTYYKINGGNSLVAYTANDPILPGEGFLVVATAGGTLTFSPSLGRSVNITEMQGNDGPTRGFCLPMHGDLTNINAYSSEVTYTIAVTANPTVGGSVQGAGTYDEGASCTLVATAYEGYSFVNWTESGNQVSTEASYTFNVSGDRTLVANFVSNQPNNYTITATASPVEGGTVAGAGTYAAGQNCTLTASANNGYVFGSWSENGEVVSTNASYSFTVSGNRTLVANFAPEGNYWTPENTGSYSLTMALTGIVQIDGVEQYSDQLEVGAFCGSECRGSQMASEFFLTNRYLVQLSISGEIGDEIIFKLYDHSLAQELDLTSPNPVTFNADGYGTPIEPYALNFISAVEISATVDPVGAGTITGAGSYAGGATCTLNAVANTGYQFVNWTLNGNVVSTNPSYAFTVTQAATYVAHFQYVHEQTLTAGWNWYSTYINQSGIDGLTMLENSLGSNGVRIQSKNNGYVDQFEYNGTSYWYGTLNAMTNEQMYMVRTNTACEASMIGQVNSSANYSITINNGWNWIGFPCNESVSVSTALNGFTPEANDQIKSKSNGYSTYIVYGNNALWYGTLNMLAPGQGYMYKSNSNESKILVYQNGRGETLADNAAVGGNTFLPEEAGYAYNMTITAVVELDGCELRSEDYELAAFVGNECRGSVKLMYVEPIDRYLAFLLVSGDVEENLRFVLTDGNCARWSEDCLMYNNDETVGTPTEPAVFHFGSMGMDENGREKVQVYPNPSKDMFNIEGDGICKVEVINAYGQVIYTKEVKDDFMQIDLGNHAIGVYLLRVVTEKGIMTQQLIKK